MIKPKKMQFNYYPLFITVFSPYLWRKASGVCFFSQDVQGHYVTQSTVSRGSEISYLEVVVLRNSIPVWGRCHRRFGNNVILYDMAGNMECMRCLHIVARSTHILQVHTEGLERCYTNEGAALTQCPTAEHIAENTAVEIMLYKKAGLSDRLPPPIYCPIEGRFKVTYNLNDGTETGIECPSADSHFSNCPYGNRVTIRFRHCSFDDFEKSFECLGSWNGTRGQQYVAFRDPAVDINYPVKSRSSAPPAPKYRCALFARDPSSENLFLAFSSDSTCFNNLRSAWDGFESLVLYQQPRPPIPAIVNASRNACQFPSWAQGQWEQLKVKGGAITFADVQEFKTFLVHCVGPPSNGLYPVYTQSHCGEERFACLAMKQRSPNVIEFRIDSTGFPFLQANACSSPSSLSWPQWITQGRVDSFRKSPCPVAGEYTGTIPDEKTLCAKLYSDCNNLEIMFYTVYACYNRSRIFEEREYRCLGQWEETGVTYTYTERRDIVGYECFAGVVMTTDEVLIVEAGINCERGLRPLVNGMKLLKQASCQGDEHWRPTHAFPLPDNPIWRESATQYPERNNSLMEEQPSSTATTLSPCWSIGWIFVILFSILR